MTAKNIKLITNNMESKKFSLNKEDFKKILVGALVAVAGALLTYLSEVVTQVDFGGYSPMVVAILSILINAGRKFITGK